jgi:hypothetical protein
MIRTAVITLYALWFAGAAAAAGPATPLLEKHCGDCHSGNAPQGKFRIDTLPAAPDTLEGAKRWGRVVARLDAGTMPPSGAERPPAADVAAVLSWAKTELASAAKAYRPNGRARLRRLNRLEYENTVHAPRRRHRRRLRHGRTGPHDLTGPHLTVHGRGERGPA